MKHKYPITIDCNITVCNWNPIYSRPILTRIHVLNRTGVGVRKRENQHTNCIWQQLLMQYTKIGFPASAELDAETLDTL